MHCQRLLVQMRQKEEKMLGKIVGKVEVSLMLTMLSLFRNNIKRRVNFAPMDKALVFISQKSEFWTPPDEELPSPNGATVSHQYFLHVSDGYIYS